MLAIISKKEIPCDLIKYHTLNSQFSIIKQSNFNPKRLQKDGWGIGWFYKGIVKIFKSKNAIYDEQDLFLKQIEKLKSKIFIFHIRHASNPRKLPYKKLISVNNSQPFTYGNIIFTHNGTLSIVDEIYSNLGYYSRYIKGVNDSEVLFFNFLKCLDAYGDIKKALLMMRDEINTIWISVKKNYKNLSKPYNGINIFVCDGEKFYALSDFMMEKEIYSLMTPKWEYGRFAIKKDKDALIISSEPTDNTNWIKLKHLSIVEVSSDLKINISYVR